MATVTFDITYSQGADVGTPGQITLNGTETRQADSRLDNVGDTVFADGFTSVPDYQVSIECTRTSAAFMQVRMIFAAFDPDASPYYCTVIEQVIDDVPLSFP